MAKKKNILVTGSEGFIGSHLVEKLLKLNYNVHALVQYNSFNSIGWLKDINKNLQKKIKISFGDIRDPQFTDKLCKNIDVIFNLAALISIPYSYVSTKSYVETNIIGTNNILHSALKCRVGQFIQTSTSEVYGTPKTVPIKENDSLNAQSPYAATKIASDQLALSFYSSYGLPVTIIRPFNTFGPRQSLRAIVPTIINQFIDQKNKYLKLGSIDTKRDFNFIDDIVNGFIKTINKKNIIGETINIGSGKEFSIREIIKIIEKITKRKLILVKEAKRIRPKKSEVMRLLASNKKAFKLLKWKPKYSSSANFEKAIKLTIEWAKKNKNNTYLKSEEYVT
jgi:NAD dependent epimerase/dehydratase|tara:strand:- start:639 stop:1649 length:1011 start_codon:yes stop_codon:yes gene_type:complete